MTDLLSRTDPDARDYAECFDSQTPKLNAKTALAKSIRHSLGFGIAAKMPHAAFETQLRQVVPPRLAEGGRILEERKAKGDGVFACMLGGDDGRTLFACAAPTLQEEEASPNHRASILMTSVEAPHAG